MKVMGEVSTQMSFIMTCGCTNNLKTYLFYYGHNVKARTPTKRSQCKEIEGTKRDPINFLQAV